MMNRFADKNRVDRFELWNVIKCIRLSIRTHCCWSGGSNSGGSSHAGGNDTLYAIYDATKPKICRNYKTHEIQFRCSQSNNAALFCILGPSVHSISLSLTALCYFCIRHQTHWRDSKRAARTILLTQLDVPHYYHQCNVIQQNTNTDVLYLHVSR